MAAWPPHSTMNRCFHPSTAPNHLGARSTFEDYPGDASGEAPPVPIPNTEVKLSSAEDTRGATPWENRSSPGYSLRQPRRFYRRGCCYAAGRGAHLPAARAPGGSTKRDRRRRRRAPMPRRAASRPARSAAPGAALPDRHVRAVRSLPRVRDPQRRRATRPLGPCRWPGDDAHGARARARMARDGGAGASSAIGPRGTRRRGGGHAGHRWHRVGHRDAGRAGGPPRRDREPWRPLVRDSLGDALSDAERTADPHPVVLADRNPGPHSSPDPGANRGARAHGTAATASAADVHRAAGRYARIDRAAVRDDSRGTPGGERDRGSERDLRRPGAGDRLNAAGSEGRLARPAECRRLSAADLAQRAATARARLATAQVHLQELAMLGLDVRRDELPDMLDGIGEH